MKPNTLLLITLLLLSITCTEREWSNPFDKNSDLKPTEWMPQNFNAVIDGKNIKLTWTNGTNYRVGFKIDRATTNSKGTTWEMGYATLTYGTTTYTDAITDVLGNSYEYRIYAVAGLNESAKANKSVSQVDANTWAPTNLAAQVVNGKVQLTWKDVSAYEENFKVDKHPANGE